MLGRTAAARRSTWVIVGALAAIAMAAMFDAIDGRSPPTTSSAESANPNRQLVGPAVPPAGALPGRLVFLSHGGCRLTTLDFASLVFSRPSAPGLCGLRVSPDGSFAAVPVARGPSVRAERISLVRLDDPPVFERLLGSVRGDVAWAFGGERIAWCRPDGVTVVLEPGSGRRANVPGCRPRIAPDGAVLTRPDRPLVGKLLRDGEPFLGRRELARAFPQAPGALVDVVGYDVGRDGLVAVAVTVFETGRLPRNALELWRAGRLEAVVRLPALASIAGRGRFGERVEVSPDGREVAVAFPGAGFRMVLVDVATRRIVLPPRSQHGFAWSPDGAWFAVSDAEEVVVYGRGRDQPAYVLPLAASGIAWR
jgi:hypothetical protein